MNSNAQALVLFLAGCATAAPLVNPTDYAAKLEECSRNAKTCDESIACENKLRASLGRPLRTGGCTE
ncbi:MAG TPA: hypothetical protein VJW73_10965 [Gemmatimonadaceae bacterium]|nr:hypothetical protein [Gemmatimonadaceae bacterium]